jgi:hypothetical protein
MITPIQKDYHKSLSNYFESKPLYLDEPKQKKPNTRKLVEQPWHLYSQNEIKGLLTFFKDSNHFIIGSKLKDYKIYQIKIISSFKGRDRINAIWSLFGMHISNGEDFLSGSGLLTLSDQLVKNDFGENTIEYVKLCYWMGWTRKKIDDLSGSRYWFMKAKKIIIDTSLVGCDDYLKWCVRELESDS